MPEVEVLVAPSLVFRDGRRRRTARARRGRRGGNGRRPRRSRSTASGPCRRRTTRRRRRRLAARACATNIRTFRCTVGAYGLRGCSTSDTPIASHARPASRAAAPSPTAAGASPVTCEKLTPPRSRHVAVLDRRAMPPPPSGAPIRRGETAGRRSPRARRRCAPADRRNNRAARRRSWRGAASPRTSGRGASARWPMSRRYCMPAKWISATAAYATRCACRTESPSAVTHSTRPPATTTLPSVERGARHGTPCSRDARRASRDRDRRSRRRCAGCPDSPAPRARRPAPRGDPTRPRRDRACRRPHAHELDEVGLEPQHDRLRLRDRPAGS